MDLKYINLVNDFITEINDIENVQIINNNVQKHDELIISENVNESIMLVNENNDKFIKPINENNNLTNSIVNLDFIIDDIEKNDKEKLLDNIKNMDDLKTMSIFVEKEIFNKAIRNYNITENINIININKLRENLLNCKFDTNYDISFIYRDYNNPNAYSGASLYEYWIEVIKINDTLQVVKIDKNDKFLKYYIKNFQITDKFRKKINNFKIRAFKKKYKF